jgi:SAM-dependent methyltransferase
VSGTVARLFDAMAPTYDELEPWYEHLYAVLHSLLRRHLAPAPARTAGRALDAGCGTGFQASALAELGYVVHGVDISAGLLGIARAKLPRTALALATLEDLPYREATFDVVTCCGSTLSFLDTPGRALNEMARVLRPGGRLLLDVEHRWSLDLAWALMSSLTGDPLGYRLSPAAAWGQIVGRNGVVTEYPGYGRLRLFRISELTALLRAAGLVTRRVWGIHVATNLFPSTVMHRQRVPRLVASVFRALRAVDTAVGRLPGGQALANSVVVLAGKPD